MNTGRTTGLILLVIAVIALLAGGGLLLTQLMTESTATAGGQMLGFVACILPTALALGAAGLFLFLRGRSEEAQMAGARRQRTILNMVMAQGKVRLDEIAFEINATREEVENLVRDLVGKQLFTGAINWKDGILYSKEAAQMKADHKCPNCGGELELAGKGVIQCPYCGSEVFLHLD